MDRANLVATTAIADSTRLGLLKYPTTSKPGADTLRKPAGSAGTFTERKNVITETTGPIRQMKITA